MHEGDKTKNEKNITKKKINKTNRNVTWVSIVTCVHIAAAVRASKIELASGFRVQLPDTRDQRVQVAFRCRSMEGGTVGDVEVESVVSQVLSVFSSAAQTELVVKKRLLKEGSCQVKHWQFPLYRLCISAAWQLNVLANMGAVDTVCCTETRS